MLRWFKRRRRSSPPAQERSSPLLAETTVVVQGAVHTLRLHHRVLEDSAYLTNRRRSDLWGKPYWQVSLGEAKPSWRVSLSGVYADDLELTVYCEMFAGEDSARLMYDALVRHPRVPHRLESSDAILECF